MKYSCRGYIRGCKDKGMCLDGSALTEKVKVAVYSTFRMKCCEPCVWEGHSCCRGLGLEFEKYDVQWKHPNVHCPGDLNINTVMLFSAIFKHSNIQGGHWGLEDYRLPFFSPYYRLIVDFLILYRLILNYLSIFQFLGYMAYLST